MVYNKMTVNISKCVHVCFTIKRKKLVNQYFLNNETIKNEATYKYQGVIFAEDWSWTAQVDSVVGREGRALSFYSVNTLEHAPFYKVSINMLERIGHE